VVTGASDGIGRETVRALARSGASVVMVGRNEAKTAAAARAIMSETGRRDVTWEIADLSRQDAVHDLAARLNRRLSHIDVLINNAGAMFLDREVTAEGLERTFALNHLAYFTLTLLLLGRMARVESARRPARVICVASRAHRDARLALDDLQGERSYSGWGAYDNSKLANILFTRALARRLDPAKVVVHAMHPGVVSTRFAMNNGRRGRLMRRVMDVVSVDATTGADTVVWLTSDDAATATTGDYWVKRARIDPSSAALDPLIAEALWERSAALAALEPDAIIAAAGVARTSLHA
jgi:NAD(P)-dependent dehydrogenase (short-subunit alcohol dehydrogenase family)